MEKDKKALKKEEEIEKKETAPKPEEKEITDKELDQASGGYPCERSDARGPKPRM